MRVISGLVLVALVLCEPICAEGKIAESLFMAKTSVSAPIYERTAANELTNYVGRAVCSRFTVDGHAGVVFHVGDTAFARKHGLVAPKMQDEEWCVRSFGRDVVLVGGGTRGTLYAVSHFLEDHLDVHWWMEGEEHVPTAKPVALPRLNEGGKPYFLERDVCLAEGPTLSIASNQTRIAVLNRLNGRNTVRPDYGGSFEWGPPSFVHTFGYYLPFNDEMKKKHLGWFSLIDGKRKGGITSGQLCLSASGLSDYMYERLMKYIVEGDAKADAMGVPRPRLYDLSMNDTAVGCKCPKCMEEVAKWGWSGQLLRFLNSIAVRIAKTRPEILITTLAYHYSEPPPKDGYRAADNIVVRLCDTGSSMAGSPYDKNNGSFMRNLQGWRKCVKNLFVWDYAICYSFDPSTVDAVAFPCAGERHYDDLYRMFRDNGVKGVFVEQESNDIADFSSLKYFLQAKLMENPSDDLEKLTKLFMDRYYGAAADLMYDYRIDVDRLRRERNGYVTWDPGIAPFNFIEDEDVVRYQALFDRAESLTAADSLRHLRVRHARVGLDLLVANRARVNVVYHGPGRPKLDASFSAGRLREYVPEWTAKYGQWMKDKKLNACLSVTNDAGVPPLVKLPPPSEFKERRFYDFYPADMYGGELIDDPASSSGKARRLSADDDKSNYCGLPFVVGYHNQTGVGLAGMRSLARPDGKGYHWYRFHVGVMPPCEWIYMTRGWGLGLRKGLSVMAGKTLETWVLLKFEGPRYFPDDPSENGKPSAISVGRMAFVEP